MRNAELKTDLQFRIPHAALPRRFGLAQGLINRLRVGGGFGFEFVPLLAFDHDAGETEPAGKLL
jgi:hypothetical protein